MDSSKLISEAKSQIDRNVGKKVEDKVATKDHKPGDPVMCDAGMGRTRYGIVQRVGPTHVFVKHNDGETAAYKPMHVEKHSKDYWADKLDAESKRRKSMKEEYEVISSILGESIEDRIEAAREKAAAKGKIKEKEPEAQPAVRKVAGKAYGGSKQKDLDEAVGVASLKKHPMWSDADHKYLKDKGYTHKEIKAIWDRDHAAGKGPVSHDFEVPDTVHYLSKEEVEMSEAKEPSPAEFDDLVKRLKARAKAGKMKTVWDPATRKYKNVPVKEEIELEEGLMKPEHEKEMKDPKTSSARKAALTAFYRNLLRQSLNRRVRREEVDLDEAVEVSHDRYIRSHGKKFRDPGYKVPYMFTHKRMGDVDYNNPDEVHKTGSMSFADAKKSAQKWAKEKGHSSVYMMEEVELDERTLTAAELKKREEIARAMEREHPGMDKSKKMAIATAAAKRVAEETEEIEEEQLDELSKNTLSSYIGKAASDVSDKRAKSLDSWDKYQSSSVGSVRLKNAAEFEKHQNAAEKRAGNIGKAAMKLAKEESELDEAKKAQPDPNAPFDYDAWSKSGKKSKGSSNTTKGSGIRGPQKFSDKVGGADAALAAKYDKQNEEVDLDDIILEEDEILVEWTIELGGKTHHTTRVPIEHYDEFKKTYPGSRVKFRGPKRGKDNTSKADATHFYIVDKKTKKVAEEVELDEARWGTFRAGSKSYFRAGQIAIKNMKAAAKERKEREEKEKAEADKKQQNEEVEQIDELSIDTIHSAIQARQKKHSDIWRDPNASLSDKVKATVEKDKKLRRSYMASQKKHIAARQQNEEVEELEESAAKFSSTVKKAEAAFNRGDHKLGKYHLDNARSYMLGMSTAESPKISANGSYAKYKDLRDRHLKEEVEQIDEISTRTLALAADAAADPDSGYGSNKYHDAQKFADYAKKHKDAKSAAAVQGAAAGKGHYPRDNHVSGYDSMEFRKNRSTNPAMVTKAGKLTKTAQRGLKSQLKSEEVELDEAEGKTPMTDKEKKLAKLAKPYDKITHKDVLVGRGAVKEEAVSEKMDFKSFTKKMKETIEPQHGKINVGEESDLEEKVTMDPAVAVPALGENNKKKCDR